MAVLVDFFTLRPIFTFWGLRLIWYMYLLNAIIQAYVGLFAIFQGLLREE